MAARTRGKVKKRKSIKLIAVFVLCILCVVGYNSIDLIKDQGKKEAKIAAYNKKIEEETQKTHELEQKRAYIQTKKYIEDTARKYLGLVYPDEVIIKPE